MTNTVSKGNKLTIACSQILLILAVWAIASVLQNLLNFPIASGVIGFFLLLMLLHTQWLKLENVEHGADVLLGELLLFFIPPVVGIIQYQELLIASGWKILFVIIISTAMVMMTSVWMVSLFLPQDDVE